MQCERPQCLELQRAYAAALRRLAMLETVVLSAQARKQTDIVDVDSELTIRELTSSSSLLVSTMQMVRDLEERNAHLEMKLAHRRKEDGTSSRPLSPRDVSGRSALDNSLSPFRPEEKGIVNTSTRRRARRTHTPNAASLLGGTEVEFEEDDETEPVSLRDALRKPHTSTCKHGTVPDSCECWNTDRRPSNIAPRTGESPKAQSPVITPISSPDSLPMSYVSQLLGGQEFENGKKHSSRVVSMRDVLRSRSLSSDSTRRRGSGPLSFRDALQIPARRPGQPTTEEDAVISMRDAFRIRDPFGPTAQHTPCSQSTVESVSDADKVYTDRRHGWVSPGPDLIGKVSPTRSGVVDTVVYGGMSPPSRPSITHVRVN
jgi:hypothetical protein